MKKLYLTLLELLATVPELRWIDLDMGQIHEENPAVAFPCALLDIDIPQSENIGCNMQHVRATFVIRLHTLTTGDTHAKINENNRLRALAYLDLLEKVHKTVQGYGNGSFYPFERTSVRQEVNRQGVKTTVLRYDTSWRDDSSS